MKAMILAAGFGTRLFPLTVDRTKPALPFLGKPLVGYVAEYLNKFGFNDIIVNLHHQPESVKKSLGDGSEFGVKIHYALEHPKILGTAGALWNAKKYLENETFLVINGKIITDIDLRAALQTHQKSGALATMILKENTNREKFTEIIAQNNLVKEFGDFPAQDSAEKNQKPKTKNHQPPMMYTGIQILEPAVFDYIPADVESDIISVFYRSAIARGEKISAHVATGKWFELSTILRYLDISLAILNGDNNGVSTNGNSLIAPTANVSDSILWDNVTIAEKATVERAILGDNVCVAAGQTIKNAAVVKADLVRNEEIPEKALPGFIVGDNYVVPLG